MSDTAPADFARTSQKLIDLLLRYIVPGGALVLTFGALQPQPFSAYRLSGTNEISQWLLLLGVAVGGPAIYSVHRALLHRMVQGLVFPIAKALNRQPYGSLSSVTAVLLEVEGKRAIWRDSGAPWLSLYEEWSAQTHFLYCSCWGLLTAFAMHLGLATPLADKGIWLSMATAITLLLSAVVGDFRALVHQLERPPTTASLST